MDLNKYNSKNTLSYRMGLLRSFRQSPNRPWFGLSDNVNTKGVINIRGRKVLLALEHVPIEFSTLLSQLGFSYRCGDLTSDGLSLQETQPHF